VNINLAFSARGSCHVTYAQDVAVRREWSIEWHDGFHSGAHLRDGMMFNLAIILIARIRLFEI
jgi:hypothetical protein